jgi:hypothetical protein
VFAICEAKDVEVLIINKDVDNGLRGRPGERLEIITFSARNLGKVPRSRKNCRSVDGVSRTVEVVTVLIAHKIALDPNRRFILRAAGTARFRQLALAQWPPSTNRASSDTTRLQAPQNGALRPTTQRHQARVVLGCLKSLKSAPYRRSAGPGRSRISAGRASALIVRKKGLHRLVQPDQRSIQSMYDSRIRIPNSRLWVRMRETLRLTARSSATVCRVTNGLSSVTVDTLSVCPRLKPKPRQVVVWTWACRHWQRRREVITGPKAHKALLQVGYKSVVTGLSRKAKGSRTAKGCQSKMARLHARIKYPAKDALAPTHDRLGAPVSHHRHRRFETCAAWSGEPAPHERCPIWGLRVSAAVSAKAQRGGMIVVADLAGIRAARRSTCGTGVLPLSVRDWARSWRVWFRTTAM